MFEVLFYATSNPSVKTVSNKSVVSVFENYLVGEKTYRTFNDFKEAIETVFSKTFTYEQINVVVTADTQYRGRLRTSMNKDTYSEVLTQLENVITAPKLTLDDLLN